MWKDLGVEARVAVLADASAALGIIERNGLGNVRHIEAAHLWIREVAAKRRLKFVTAKGQYNPADLMVKELAAADIERHVEVMGAEFITGTAILLAGIDVMEKAKFKQENSGAVGPGSPHMADRPEEDPVCEVIASPEGRRHQDQIVNHFEV